MRYLIIHYSNTVSLSTVEDAFTELGDDDIVLLKDAGSKDPDSKDMEDDQASDLPEGREEKGQKDNIKWIKREITRQVGTLRHWYSRHSDLLTTVH